MPLSISNARNVKRGDQPSGIIDSFTANILAGKAPEIDGFEGYQSLNVILTAMEAAKEGRTLKIK